MIARAIYEAARADVSAWCRHLIWCEPCWLNAREHEGAVCPVGRARQALARGAGLVLAEGLGPAGAVYTELAAHGPVR